jgi:hypothetical protein
VDLFTIADKTFSSRLIVGTGKYSSPAVMVQAHDASGAEMITVAVRRVNISDRSKESLLDFIDTSKLPAAHTPAATPLTKRCGRRVWSREARPVELGEARGDRRRRTLFPTTSSS